MKPEVLSDYKNVSIIPLLFFGILTMDTIILFFARYFPQYFGTPLNEWYTRFGIVAVLCDVLSLLLCTLLTRYLYSLFIKPIYGWNIYLFAALLLFLQISHDILFYIGIILPLPAGENKIIDLFKTYSRVGGGVIIAADSILILGCLGISLFYMRQPSHVVVACSALASYALTYILYTPPKF
jgi:hypothetical protein